MAAEKIALESAHQDELESVRSTTIVAAKAEAQQEAKDNLLILSKFLRAAASKRQDGDETAPENRAFEGALLLVYGGDANAVQAMEKLIDGSEENVPATDGTVLEVTCMWILELPCLVSLIRPRQDYTRCRCRTCCACLCRRRSVG